MPYDGMFIFEDVAYGFIPNEAGAAFGLEQLNKLEHFFELRDSRFQKHAEYPEATRRRVRPRQFAGRREDQLDLLSGAASPRTGWSRRDLQVFLEDREFSPASSSPATSHATR